jgi:hypothetical protein
MPCIELPAGPIEYRLAGSLTLMPVDQPVALARELRGFVSA